MELLRCENLSLAYEGVTVASDINFSVENGDYLSIVGENGSGKSTLIKGILGFVKQSGGKILYENGLKRTQIGYLPQQTAVRRDFPASVYEVVMSGCLNSLGARAFFSHEQKEKAQYNMERLGIADLKKRCFRELSGGQRQRLCIARAILKSPKILILDDSTSAVDTKTDALIRQAFLEKIPHTTRIIISQRVSSIQDADQILVIDDGKISGLGTHEELLKSNAMYKETFEAQNNGGDFDEQ